jgi:putative lipoic acid-binding regulatory protein
MDEEKKPSLLELLQKQHSFPGPYTFKFIGKAEDDFPQRLVASVRATLGLAEDPPHTTRPSANGGHVSVTIVPMVSAPEGVVAVYEKIREVAGLLVSL